MDMKRNENSRYFIPIIITNEVSQQVAYLTLVYTDHESCQIVYVFQVDYNHN